MQSLQSVMKRMHQNTTSDFSLPEVVREYDCPKCSSTVQVMKTKILGKERLIDRCLECENIAMAIEAERERKAAISRKMQQYFDSESLINHDLKGATFELYLPTNGSQEKAKRIAFRFAEAFKEDEPRNLLLTGPYGVGKSHLAVSITKELMSKGHSCIFIATPRLFTKIKSTFSKKSEITEEQVTETLAKVDCLVLDDIGAEHIETDLDGAGRGWGLSKIFEIVDSRTGKHTIFTTNLNSAQMRKRFGERNFSRLMKGTVPVPVEGEDYRLKDFKGA